MIIMVIGASVSGVMTACAIKKLNPHYQVIILEKNNFPGYIANSSKAKIAFNLPSKKRAYLYNKQELAKQGIELIVEANVCEINVNSKQVIYKNLQLKERKLSYDKLILAMGSIPEPNEPFLKNFKNVGRYRNDKESTLLWEKIDSAKNIVMIGSGCTGMELADKIVQSGKTISIIEYMNNPLFKYYDNDFMNVFLKELPKKAHLYLANQILNYKTNDKATRIEKINLINTQLTTDLIIDNSNLMPNTKLVMNQLKMDFDQTILVNQWYQTSNKDVFAVGDLVKHYFHPVEESIYMPLTSNALYSALLVASYITYGAINQQRMGVNRTITNYLFDYYLASTGLLEDESVYYGKRVRSFMTEVNTSPKKTKAQKMLIKLVFKPENYQLVGAQLLSRSNQVELINLLSTMITKNYTFYEIMISDTYVTLGKTPLVHPIKQAVYDYLISNRQANFRSKYG